MTVGFSLFWKYSSSSRDGASFTRSPLDVISHQRGRDSSGLGKSRRSVGLLLDNPKKGGQPWQ